MRYIIPAMFCPECRAEYRPGFTPCADCDVDLVTKLPKQDWLDKAYVGTVGVLTLDGDECLTAEIVDFNDERGELIVDVVSSKRPHPHNTPTPAALRPSKPYSKRGALLY